MNLQISCIVNGNTEYIELFGNEAFTMDISFAEIQDITKKNSSYSKDLNVPGSKNNNYIFNYFFDFNQVPLDFIPNKKFEASVLYNGYVIMQGYIRLNNVVINGIEKTYNITFYNGVGDVASNIGDKFMAQLDLTHLEHPFTSDVYLQSTLDPNLFPLTGTTNYSYQNGKTFWGLINIGYNYINSLSSITQYYTTTSTTSVNINSGQKSIITAAAKPFIIGDTIRLTNPSTGYWIQGIVNSVVGTTIVFQPNLGLGTGTFSVWNVSIELAEGATINDPTTTPLLEFQTQNVPNYMSFSGTPIRQYYFKPSIQIKELYEQIFKQAGYEIESKFFNTSYFEKYYLPLKFLDETIYTKGSVQPCFSYSGGELDFNINEIVNPSNIITCNNIPFPFSTSGFTIPAGFEGQYTVLVNAKTTAFLDDGDISSLIVNVIINGVSTQIISEFQQAPSFITIGDVDFDVTAPFSFTTTGETEVQLQINIGGQAFLETFTFEITSAPRVIVGNFNYANEFPDNNFKQIDFITSINKMFNFVCVPHITKPKTLVVEPIIDYIGKGKILDWSEKIDFDSPITVSPTSNYLNGTILYNYNLDQDYANQQFNIANNRIFGTYELQLNQDYKDNKINFSTIFGSPIDLTLNNSNLPAITISSLAAIKTQEAKAVSIQQFNPYKILPRIIFRGVVLANENWSQISTGDTTQYWWAETNRIDRWQETNRFTTYPFSYTGFSHYTNWNSNDYFDAIEYKFPNQQDMYDIYYYDYISDIISSENKVISAKIYLTPYEIANLEFNEKIIVKNSYFRVNKITGYNLTEPSLCNIELIKLTKNYTSHPVQYYDLISCTGGTNYHTTSDLNYNMYAYVGNYVNIFTGQTTGYTSIGCFQVQLGEPTFGIDYEHVFIGSGYTSEGVNVYNNCGCTGRTQMILVQQEYPQPTSAVVITQTPTPSPTETPPPTPSATQSATPTPTPTTTGTPTPTPSGTPEATDADANAYLEAVVSAGGTGITATVSAITQSMFVDLKTAGLYDKLDALYPFLGGVAASAKFNAKNPIDTDGAFRLVFNGGGTFSQDIGYIGNATNAWADTKWIQNAQTTTGNTSIGFFISMSGSNVDGFDMGSNTSGTWLAIDSSRIGNMRGGIESGLVNYTAQTPSQAINFNAISRASNTTVLFVARGGGVQSFASTGNSTLQNVVTGIGQAVGFGSYSDSGWGTAFIGEGLTSTELGNLRDIITIFNTALGRDL
jgi:hypothetical protein